MRSFHVTYVQLHMSQPVLLAWVCKACRIQSNYYLKQDLHHYPRVTSFGALKQLAGIFAHLITFSNRKYIILNKLSCFKSKHTFSEVREHLFCLKYRCQRVYVCLHHYFDRHQFRRLSLAVEENDFFTVAQCSQGVLCIVQERPKIISSS